MDYQVLRDLADRKDHLDLQALQRLQVAQPQVRQDHLEIKESQANLVSQDCRDSRVIEEKSVPQGHEGHPVKMVVKEKQARLEFPAYQVCLTL